MRHGKKINHLGRQAGHRKSMLANMACSLIEHKRINTTVAKAKALKQFVEPLVTKSKTDDTHNRRVVFSYLRSKYAVAELFREVAPKVGNRPGGYTRIIRTGNRLGDNAEMCMMELVDFNELYVSEGKAPAKKKTRRRRGGGGSSATTEAKVQKEDKKAEVSDVEAKTKETKKESEKEAPKAKKEETSAKKEEKKSDDQKEDKA